MQVPDPLIGIGAQGPVVRVIGMGGQEYRFRCGRAAYGYYNGCMRIDLALEIELNEVARQQILKADLGGKGAWCRLAAQEKVAEVLDYGPGGGLIVGINVIPTVGRGVIHHAGAGVKTL